MVLCPWLIKENIKPASAKVDITQSWASLKEGQLAVT